MCNISSYFLIYIKSQQNLIFYIDIDNNKKYTMDLQTALNKISAEKEKLEKENIELNYKLKTEISGTNFSFSAEILFRAVCRSIVYFLLLSISI